ncbi:hypothetical protein ACFLX5_01460 [Chloroflexota bacterium]
MPKSLKVSIEPNKFTVATGDTVQATATVRNLGQTVDQFTISIDGLNNEWYHLPVSSISLFPNDECKISIIFHPPRPDVVEYGLYEFQLIVSSQDSPDDNEVIGLLLEVKASPELKLEVTPQRITGRRGTYKILISNPRDKALELQLEAADDEALLRYDLRPKMLTVPGGGVLESILVARLRWIDFFIREKSCDFQILATISDSNEVKTAIGRIVISPWYRPITKIRLPNLRIPWISRPPTIIHFLATTDDNREFKFKWAVKRAFEVKLDDENVDNIGERDIRPINVANYILTASNNHGSVSQTIDVHPITVPAKKTSDRIRVLMEPTEIEVNAGGVPAVATLEIHNLEEMVDQFSVEVEGLSDSWFSRSASSIALMPQAADSVQISFHPPNTRGVKSGIYLFAVIVSSRVIREETTIIIGQLNLLPSVEFAIKVSPISIACRRKGNFRINIANKGISDVELFIDAADDADGLRFEVQNSNPFIPAWQTTEIPLIAKPKRGFIVGERQRYFITVTIKTADGNSQTAHCELHHRPFIGSWRPILRLLITVAIIVIIGLIVNYIVGLGGGWRDLLNDPQEWFYTIQRKIKGLFF